MTELELDVRLSLKPGFNDPNMEAGLFEREKLTT